MANNYKFLLLDQNTKREQGRKVQLGNVAAAKVSPNVLDLQSYSRKAIIFVQTIYTY